MIFYLSYYLPKHQLTAGHRMSETLPRNLTVEALALSPAEQRAYPRWYTDILLRKRSESIATGDILNFVGNFGISGLDKQRILNLFGAKLVMLDPPQFYAFLRLAGHVLQGKAPRRELAFVAAPVPKPKSILAKRKASASTQQSNPFKQGGGDIDSFMSLMTGGGGEKQNGVEKKRKKRVTFDSGPPQVAEAAHRSMSELLRQRQIFNPIPPPPEPEQEEVSQEETQGEPEPEPAVNSQFAHINIDSVLHNGVSTVPPAPPPPRLQPNMTGPVQAEQMGTPMRPGDSFINDLQQQTSNGSLQPQSTGPRTLQNQGTGSSQVPSAIPQRPDLRMLSPQGSGIQPQNTGPTLSPQISGIQQPNTRYGNLSPQVSGLQSQNSGPQILAGQGSGTSSQSFGSQSLGVQPQYSGMQGSQIQPQLSGRQPQNPAIQVQYYGAQSSVPAMQPQYSGMQPQYSGTGMQNQYSTIQPQYSGGATPGLLNQQPGFLAQSFTNLAPTASPSYPQSSQWAAPQMAHSSSYPNQASYNIQQTQSPQMHGSNPPPAFPQAAYPAGYTGPSQPGMQFVPNSQGTYDFSAMRQQVPRW